MEDGSCEGERESGDEGGSGRVEEKNNELRMCLETPVEREERSDVSTCMVACME